MKFIFIAHIYCGYICHNYYSWTYLTNPFHRWWSHSLFFSSCGVHLSADVRSLRINRLDYRAFNFLNGLGDWRLCRTGGLVPERRWDQITIKTEQKLRWNRQGGSLNPPVQVSSDLIRPCCAQLARRLMDASVRSIWWSPYPEFGRILTESRFKFILYQGNSGARLIHVPWSLRTNYVLATAQVWILSWF